MSASDTIPIDTSRLNDLLGKIQDGLPRGYKVTLLVRHPSRPTGHVLLTDDTDAGIQQGLEDLKRPDTRVTEPRP